MFSARPGSSAATGNASGLDRCFHSVASATIVRQQIYCHALPESGCSLQSVLLAVITRSPRAERSTRAEALTPLPRDERDSFRTYQPAGKFTLQSTFPGCDRSHREIVSQPARTDVADLNSRCAASRIGSSKQSAWLPAVVGSSSFRLRPLLRSASSASLK